jgi:putative ABC transport system permease protein
MNIFQSVAIALEMLRQHKLRAFLTMLGVIIGVMSVTMIVMISSAFQEYLNSQFKKIGSDTMFVFFDPGRRGRGETTGGIERLTLDDKQYVLNRVTSVDLASAIMQVPSTSILYKDKSYDSPQIYASDEYFQELNKFDLKEGRTLSKADLESKANVCVIGEDLQSRLFGGVAAPDDSTGAKDPAANVKRPTIADTSKGEEALGRLVTLNGITLQVVGVFKRADFMGQTNSRMVLMPLTTAQSKWVGGSRIDFMLFRPKKGIKVNEAMQAIWEALMVKSGNKAIYRLDSRETILQVLTSVLGVAGAALAGIAALSLLVGGIGIMNIMLVSVTERTREIGLRKAVGARQEVILTQFLVEAATLSLVGGLIGMFIAWMLGNIVTLITVLKHWPGDDGLSTPFPIPAALGAAVFSALIGVVFGLYPAISAARLDPIVALRHE